MNTKKTNAFDKTKAEADKFERCRGEKKHMDTNHPEQPAASTSARILRNLLFAAIAATAVYATINSQPGYKWVYNSLLKGNMEMIRQYPNLSADQKLELKLRDNYTFVRYIKNSTPQNAVIVFPDWADLRDKKSPFSNDISNKLYLSRYLYPRKVVLKSELATQPDLHPTHAAIICGVGFDLLTYPVEQKFEHGVIPIVSPHTK